MPYDPMNQVHPGPLEGIDRIPADTAQARTGNTERRQKSVVRRHRRDRRRANAGARSGA